LFVKTGRLKQGVATTMGGKKKGLPQKLRRFREERGAEGGKLTPDEGSSGGSRAEKVQERKNEVKNDPLMGFQETFSENEIGEKSIGGSKIVGKLEKQIEKKEGGLPGHASYYFTWVKKKKKRSDSRPP